MEARESVAPVDLDKDRHPRKAMSAAERKRRSRSPAGRPGWINEIHRASLTLLYKQLQESVTYGYPALTATISAELQRRAEQNRRRRQADSAQGRESAGVSPVGLTEP